MQSPHIPVLLNEVLNIFSDLNEGVFLDCTLGYAGHSYELLKHHPKLYLYACDQDEMALEFSKKKLADFSQRVQIIKSNFCDILDKIDTNNLKGILADIGVSSLQLDYNERGFALDSDFLDMRMDKSTTLDAKMVVNSYSKEKLRHIFLEYGELENEAEIIAQKICKARLNKEITTAKELVEIIGKGYFKGRKVLKAILVFQAIRIEVNNELGVLKQFLEKLKKIKPKGCKVAIISFHSLEDRMIKNAFKEWSKNCICHEMTLKCECGNNHSLGKILSKKAIIASKEEIYYNSRSSCAKMRVFQFLG
ncbi:16S rRNA (cytosine(1402)-N(4))-methyltransferase RsmH [Campylobacter sp. US33a]|uniref:16S rRNA (cytosine(1402)-N(4))-methyltransferase RsmH n=1 Tax=Campylobacter sp. US33a TaxID=2498120 RepID=UPI001067FB64|nr:16S rRNA (cytosine(1402)-N(4))-methyltransferase RsmH [Campylobacter sp. US33a]TEY03510.1 16S rRNA (cytosine(1402)-N(4))-methyltransferase RsmH [Campylobacter sp. US33a]